LNSRSAPRSAISQRSVSEPDPKVYAVPADYLDIREEDAPGMKKLAALDSTQLEYFQEEMKAEKNR